jgi:cellulose synthase/poly-beta-1,6-N-acetylglucosamine synthase-like glycosyltransferase
MRKGLLHRPIIVFGPVLDKIVFTHVVVIGLPTVLYYIVLKNGGNLLPLHVLIPILYLLTTLVVMGEALATATAHASTSMRKPRLGLIQRFWRLPQHSVTQGGQLPIPLRPLPRCSLIVVAYLPNEQHIILDTLKYILQTVQRPAAGLELILAYNSPVQLPVEEDLRQLAAAHPELRLLPVAHSRSKAENLNAALQIVTGEVTGILDADHLPNADCFERAWGWLEANRYAVVQGRNVIRNHDHNFLTRMIAVEFECMYGVSHPAKSLLVDTGMFCGSNGYWRTAVLRRMRFSPSMLTEDIDATLRTLLRGHAIVHDPKIITTELAPVNLRALWFQRKRWAQGWLEVALKHQIPILRSHKLDGWQKGYWTMLLIYSAMFHFVALQIFPMLLSLALSDAAPPQVAQEYVWSTTALTLLSGPLQTLVAWHIRDRKINYTPWSFVTYCFFIPLYCVLKNIIAIIAIYDHILGNTEWVVTGRVTRHREVLAQPQVRLTYAKSANRSGVV